MTEREYDELVEKKRKIVNNHKQLAHEVYELTNNFEWVLNHKERWELLDGNASMNMSEDCMCLYIWQTPVDQVRSFVKIVPNLSLGENDIEKILKAQPWVCV